MIRRATASNPLIRRQLEPGDCEAIVDLHDRIYSSEYGLDQRSRATVIRAVAEAREQGWPERAGAVWLVGRAREVRGTLALTIRGADVGQVHWFVLSAELRGQGLGRALMAELMVKARQAGLERLELETFSALTAAAKIYRDVGFRVVWEHEADKWGPLLRFQGYELELR